MLSIANLKLINIINSQSHAINWTVKYKNVCNVADANFGSFQKGTLTVFCW